MRSSGTPNPKQILLPVLPLRDVVHFPNQINTLHVVREASLRAIRKAMDGERRVLVLSQKDMSVEEPRASDLVDIGTISETIQAVPLPDTSLRVALRGLQRKHATRLIERNGCLWAEVEDIDEEVHSGIEVETLVRACITEFTAIVQMSSQIPPESLQGMSIMDIPGEVADVIAHHLMLRPNDKQKLLEEPSDMRRLEMLLPMLKRERQILDLDREIHSRVERELGDSQREFYLREQIRVIQGELKEVSGKGDESEDYRDRIESAKMPPEARAKAITEIRRLDRTPSASPENMVIRNYLDTLINLPWSVQTEDRIDVHEAARLLDLHHAGLDKVKDRILDHLAVHRLTNTVRGPILCFVGPPGVGKTSLGQSIAESMGRKFVRIALGGIRDEADIRGHRRTYVASMPGRILKALIDCGSNNPVVVLDEIDKIAHGPSGDPTSALLEALDPGQNDRFVDHYIECPFDLSHAMFIATANLVENVPPPLRDRMEIVHFPAYTPSERSEIARQFLIPRACREHGFGPDDIRLSEDTIRILVSEYTREAGVRDLDRKVNAVCRKAARKMAEGAELPILIDRDFITTRLGSPTFHQTRLSEESEVGVAWGLVVSQSGGDVLPIEVSLLPRRGETPALRLTGLMGEVMRESAQAALTYVRSIADQIGIEDAFAHDIHIHMPEGAVSKDGPSGGLALSIALASAMSRRAVLSGVAMTGEVTLRGHILAVGGIRDKVIAASASGFRKAIVPKANQNDLDEIPPEISAITEIILVDNALESIKLALSPSQ